MISLVIEIEMNFIVHSPALLVRGVAPDEPEVQDMVKRHYSVFDHFWTPNRESYTGLGRTYCEHSDFRKLYDGYHPKLAEYLAEAIKIFAERELG